MTAPPSSATPDPPDPFDRLGIRLVNILYERAEAQPRPISAHELELLNKAARVEADVGTTLRTWRIALDICMTVPASDKEALAPVAQAISSGLIMAQRFAEGTAWIATIPLLARLIEVLARCDLGQPARRVLAVYRERMNRFAMAYPGGEAYLQSRPDTSLTHAVIAAFENVDRELALLCAEAGRVKMMASMLSRRAKAPDDTSETSQPVAAVQVSPLEAPDSLPRHNLLIPYELSYDDFNSEIMSLHQTADAFSWIRQLTYPWMQMSAVYSGHADPFERLTESDWKTWLVEPTMENIVSEVGEDRVLFYPVFGSTWIGVIMARDDWVHSIILREEEVRDLSGKSLNHPDGIESAGALVAPSLITLAKDRTPFLVSWCVDDNVRFQSLLIGLRRVAEYEVAPSEDEQRRNGPAQHDVDDREQIGKSSTTVCLMPLVIPSVRLLDKRGTGIHLQTVSFFGDSLGDLAGSWLEDSAWRIAMGERQYSSRRGAHVGRQALIEAFSSADLLILSLHAQLAGRHLDPILQLADGAVSYEDVLLTAGSVPTQLILSSCSAGRTGSSAPRDEVVGLATSLLMRGARRVLAPTVVVNDGLAAALGCLLARRMAVEADLRVAWTSVTEVAEAAAGIKGMTIGDLLGNIDLDPAFPYPQMSVDRLLRRPASGLRETANQYVLFGT